MQKNQKITVVIIDNGQATITTQNNNPYSRRSIVGEDFDMVFPKTDNIAIMRSRKKDLAIILGYNANKQVMTSLSQYQAENFASSIIQSIYQL